MGRKMEKWIDLSSLPKKNGHFDWKNSVGCECEFQYDDINGCFKIVGYEKEQIEFYYKNDKYKMKTVYFKDCKFGNILNKIKPKNYDFVFKIGDELVDGHRNLTITNAYKYHKRNIKTYGYVCNVCGCSQDKIYESDLLLGGGCPVCSNKKVVKGINDIASTHSYLGKYFVNIEDTYKYTYSSNKIVEMKCPQCNYLKKMRISSLFNCGFSCKYCGDGVSIPEKFIANMLKQLNIDFEYQLTHTYFDWLELNNKRYDFYIPIKNCIIETHGVQHYEHRGFSKNNPKTLEDEQKNDKFKRELALSNGILYYIELDCRKSELEWIKNSVMTSELPQLLNFKEEDVDWIKCLEATCSSKIVESWNFYNDNKNTMQLIDMAKILDVTPSTLIQYLKKGTLIGKCDYVPKCHDNHVTGITGVNYKKETNRWQATFNKNGLSKRKTFLTKEEAINQRQKWENGDFTEEKSLRLNNTSGITGVTQNKKGMWIATYAKNYKKWIKTFANKEDAIAQRIRWENGDFTKEKSLQRNNTSGITGIIQKENGNWAARISINNKNKSKSFKTKEEAIQQRLEWEKEREEIYKNIK